MTYIPIIPTTPTAPQQTDNDHRDLITALKLLSGKDCVRDERQAQVLLVGLTESRHDEVKEDARAVMRAGLSRGWFEDTVPKYFELRNIAERSIAKHERGPDRKQQQQLVMVAVGLLVFLMLGLVMFFRASGGELQIPWVMVAIVGMIVVLGVVVALKAKLRS